MMLSDGRWRLWSLIVLAFSANIDREIVAMMASALLDDASRRHRMVSGGSGRRPPCSRLGVATNADDIRRRWRARTAAARWQRHATADGWNDSQWRPAHKYAGGAGSRAAAFTMLRASGIAANLVAEATERGRLISAIRWSMSCWGQFPAVVRLLSCHWWFDFRSVVMLN